MSPITQSAGTGLGIVGSLAQQPKTSMGTDMNIPQHPTTVYVYTTMAFHMAPIIFHWIWQPVDFNFEFWMK